MKNKVASIIFINNKNEILLYLRDNKKSIPYPGYWATLGGHLEKNEALIEALKREIKEEINFNLNTKDIKFLGIADDLVGHDVYLYKSKINKKSSDLKLAEGQKLKFFDFKEIMKLKIPKPLKYFIIKNENAILA